MGETHATVAHEALIRIVSNTVSLRVRQRERCRASRT